MKQEEKTEFTIIHEEKTNSELVKKGENVTRKTLILGTIAILITGDCVIIERIRQDYESLDMLEKIGFLGIQLNFYVTYKSLLYKFMESDEKIKSKS